MDTSVALAPPLPLLLLPLPVVLVAPLVLPEELQAARPAVAAATARTAVTSRTRRRRAGASVRRKACGSESGMVCIVANPP
jgi:hypothetical protein